MNRRLYRPLMLRRPDQPLAVIDAADQAKSKSAQGTIAIAIAQAIKFLIQFASQIILARLLAPSDFGLVAMIFPIIAALQIFNDVGISQILIVRQYLDDRFTSSLFWINMALGTFIGLVAIILGPITAYVFHDPRLVGLMLVTGIGVPLSSIGAHPHCLLMRQMRFGESAAIGVFASLVGLATTATTAYLGWGYWALVAGQYSSTIFSNIVSWWACGWLPGRPRWDRDAFKSVAFGGNITGANLAIYVTTAGDNAIIAYSFSSFMLGLYDRSYRLVVQPISQLLAPVATTAGPLLARLRHDEREYRETYLAVLQLIVGATIPGMAVCAILPADVLGVLLGQRWTPAAPIFQWISVGGLASAMYSSVTWLYISQERTKELMQTTAVSSVVNLVAYLIGARYGIAQVAEAGALTFIFVNVPVGFGVVLRRGPIKLSDMVRQNAVQYGAAGVCVPIILAVVAAVPLSPWPRILLCLAIAYACMAAAVMAFREERVRFLKTFGFGLRSARSFLGIPQRA